jgi:hypothetical protein
MSIEWFKWHKADWWKDPAMSRPIPDMMVVAAMRIARATIIDMMADPDIAAVVNRDDMAKNVKYATSVLDEEIKRYSFHGPGAVETLKPIQDVLDKKASHLPGCGGTYSMTGLAWVTTSKPWRYWCSKYCSPRSPG